MENDNGKDCAMLWVDGACSGNPGPGGWAALAIIGGREVTAKGSAPETTNNKMELMALLQGLKLVPKELPVVVKTDSAYIITCTRHCKEPDWIAAHKNPGLVLKIARELEGRKVRIEKVKAHNGVLMNETVDRMARSMIR